MINEGNATKRSLMEGMENSKTERQLSNEHRNQLDEGAVTNIFINNNVNKIPKKANTSSLSSNEMNDHCNNNNNGVVNEKSASNHRD